MSNTKQGALIHLKEETFSHLLTVETVDNGWIVTLEYDADGQEDEQYVFCRNSQLRLWLIEHFEKQVLAIPENS